MVQLSQPYVITGKTIALTIRTFVGRIMSLLVNILSRFVAAFLPRSNHLISWLQSPSAVILELKKRKSVTTSICHEVVGPGSSAILQCRRPQFNSWIGKTPWRRDRLPTPVFLCFPGFSDGQESACSVRPVFDRWVGKIPWRRAWQPTPVFLPGETQGQRSLGAVAHGATKSRTQLRN